MVSGFDRYFQIAPCFRDEAARADRSPGEFYQLDMEMSFATQEDVFAVIEPVMQGVFEEFADGKRVTPAPFPRIPFREAVGKYGSDKPDLRNPIEMADVSQHFRGSGFQVFANILNEPKAAIWAIPAPGGGSRAFCDRMNDWAKGEGQPGLAYIFWREGEEGGAGPVARNIGPERAEAIRAQLDLKVGDAVFFAAGQPQAFYRFAGLARTKVGTDLGLVDEAQFKFCWIVDFPMYEFNEDTRKIDFSHNPFSMPQGEMDAFRTNDPLDILAYQYDIVCNGTELSSGAVRNHRPEIMLKAFELAGYTARRGRGAVRRHAERVPPRRAAARRSRPGDRSHRHAAGRRDRDPRRHRLPAQPEGRGPADGRAVEGARRTAEGAERPPRRAAREGLSAAA